MKKVSFVLATVFAVLAVIFGIEAFLFNMFPSDSSNFTDNIIYNEAIVSTLIEVKNEASKETSGYFIEIKDNEGQIWVDLDSLTERNGLDSLKEGDLIRFGLTPSAQNSFENGEPPFFVTATFLSSGEKIIVSLESYEKHLDMNDNEIQQLAIIIPIVFGTVSILFYVVWFFKKQKEKRYRKTEDCSRS